jgi:hypothetical protein
MNEVGKTNLKLAVLDITTCNSSNQYYVTVLLLYDGPYRLSWFLYS